MMDLRALGIGASFRADLVIGLCHGAGDRCRCRADPVAGDPLYPVGGDCGGPWRGPGAEPAADGAQFRAVLVFGLCQNAIYLGLNFTAMQWIEASLAAIIASTMPLLVAGLGWLLLGQRLPRLGVLGLVVGFAGVGLIMAARLQGGADPLGVAMCLIAALALAGATLTLRGVASGGNVLVVVGYQMGVGAVTLAALAALVEPWRLSFSPHWAAAMAYQILMPGIFATVLWFALVRRIGAVKAATFHFLNPFFGVVIAALLLG